MKNKLVLGVLLSVLSSVASSQEALDKTVGVEHPVTTSTAEPDTQPSKSWLGERIDRVKLVIDETFSSDDVAPDNATDEADEISDTKLSTVPTWTVPMAEHEELDEKLRTLEKRYKALDSAYTQAVVHYGKYCGFAATGLGK